MAWQALVETGLAPLFPTALVETGLAPLFPTVLLRLQLPAVTALPPDQTPPLQFHDYLQKA
ncbi:hypothetical protein T484DRAFT_1916796 [Baffinella frigidus]|nr:hypothetical protein T484DRAFT_1916796 [Cryptophyta sp. CCMP2293]